MASALGRLVAAKMGVEFTDRMLSWPPGPRDTDGVWAEPGYASVQASTGFGVPPDTPPDLPGRLEPLAAECRPHYDELASRRI